MTPVLYHRGPAGQRGSKNEKAPSVTGGAPKNPSARIPRTRKLSGSPARGGLNGYGTPRGRL